MNAPNSRIEDFTQLAWGTGLVDAVNAFLRTARLDNLEVDQVVVVDGRYLAINTTDVFTPEAGLYHYDRHYREER
jgi:hypothetical protein